MSPSHLPAHDVDHNDDSTEQSHLVPSSPRKDTPLPVRPITILILMRLAEPISFSLIFPFVNDMVYTLPPHPPLASVGFYAGIIESLFSVTQTFTILFWGSLSDRIGRKPVLISGLTGVVCSSVLFGLSRSFTWAVLARCLAGATNGNVAIVKSVMGELTDESNQARAFSYLSLTWVVGCFIGPLLGGYLSRPAEQYPSVFGEGGWAEVGGLWIKYPFLLPCLVSAATTVGSIGLGWMCLEETLPAIVERKRIQREQKKGPSHQGDSSQSNGYGAVDTNAGPQSVGTNAHHQPHARRASASSLSVTSWNNGYTPPHTPPRSSSPTAPPSILHILSIAQIQSVLLSYAFLALISVALDAVLVLYLYEPATLGGVGFTSDQTGILLSVNGLGGALIQLFLYPPLQKRYGTLRVYQLSMIAYPLSVVLLPVANVLARRDTASPSTAVWICLLVSTTIRVVGGMAYASNTILVNQCSTFLGPTQALGTLNSLAQMNSSIMRAIGPYLANTLFAVSVTKHLLGGQLVWLVLGLIGCVGPLVCAWIKDMEPRNPRRAQDELT